jgi:type I restriction enzyme S subunit
VTKHWLTKRLGDIFDIARGGSPRPIENFITDSSDGLNWIKIGDASASGKYIRSTKEKIRPEGLTKTRLVNPGDFLLTNSMSFGRPYIMAIDGCIHDGWLVLKPKLRELIDQDYFYHLLGSDAVYEQFSARASGSTVKNLNTGIVSSIEIKLPPLNEQRRIAAILDKADELRRKRKRTVELLNGLTQSIFLEMFGDPIDHPRYPTRRLDELVDSDKGISYGIVQRGEDQETGIKVLRISDIVDGYITGEGLKQTSPEVADKFQRTKLKGNEIVISIRGTVGRCAVVPSFLKGANVSREIAVIPTTISRLNPFYLSLIRTDSAQRRLARDVKGVAQSGINLEDLRELPIILPPQSEIERFLSANCHFQRVELNTREHSDSLVSLSSSLQDRAFSGHL